MLKKIASQWMSASRVSPTALYTGQVWQANQRSVPELASTPARLLHAALAPAMLASRTLGGPTLSDFLLARHDLIDHELTRRIEAGKVTQIIELAAGLSPRGARFVERYGDRITYIEADLPSMVAQKRKLLAQRLAVCPNHQVRVVDAFANEGAYSLEEVARGLNPKQGVAIVSEGLLNYFNRDMVMQLWARIESTLDDFPYGAYLADLHLRANNADPLSRAFAAALGAFVRGKVHLHFDSAGEVQLAMESVGMACEVYRPADFADRLPSCKAPGANLTRVLRARPASQTTRV
ncbi:class I SAM-dependent methyltransferase [Limnobacter sp.]|uniref:class I SAM-dependent methyltransferase n=1 Tax=Limnobacter sp. TaxID=2003368 RepID=UPI0035148434